MLDLFHEFLYRPLFNALIALYVYLPGADLGFAIIALTIAVRVILYPLTEKQFRSQGALSTLRPKIQEIRQKYKDKQEQSKKMMELYKKEGVNPASGCLPLIVQLPVLIALYRVFFNGLDPEALSLLYSWVPKPGEVNPIAFGVLNLKESSVVLAVAAGLFQFLQAKLMLSKQPAKKKNGEVDMSGMMNKQMLYVMPIVVIWLGLSFPAGLTLYWVVTSILGILQQTLIKKRHGPTAKPTAS